MLGETSAINTADSIVIASRLAIQSQYLIFVAVHIIVLTSVQTFQYV